MALVWHTSTLTSRQQNLREHSINPAFHKASFYFDRHIPMKILMGILKAVISTQVLQALFCVVYDIVNILNIIITAILWTVFSLLVAQS